jgi:SAM-dependent methyltransferase
VTSSPGHRVSGEALAGFYASHRHRAEDIYPSERRFLPWLAVHSRSVLDVGCAAGGFADIWAAFNHEVTYRGVDISAELVALGQRLRPQLQLEVGDAADGLALTDRCADTVQALGWLHWEPRYAAALTELWRLTRRCLFFDVRLAPGDRDVTGAQALSFDGVPGPAPEVPYLVVAWPAFAELLVGLSPATILGYGYWGPPSAGVTGVHDRVCFATFVLERRFAESPEGTRVAAELPLEWPAHQPSVSQLGAQWLATHITSESIGGPE